MFLLLAYVILKSVEQAVTWYLQGSHDKNPLPCQVPMWWKAYHQQDKKQHNKFSLMTTNVMNHCLDQLLVVVVSRISVVLFGVVVVSKKGSHSITQAGLKLICDQCLLWIPTFLPSAFSVLSVYHCTHPKQCPVTYFLLQSKCTTKMHMCFV